MEALVQRLVQNPHDQEAITYAHHAGQSDPRSYAMLLEKVGTATSDPAFACHWLTEAAQVWSETLGDAHRAARALMIAIDRDPTQPTPAERLATLYRDKGDTKALVALQERRAKALAPLAHNDPDMRAHVAGIHEELGRLWSEPPLSQTKKAIENYRRAIEYDPASQYAIYALRELLKAGQMWADAIPYFSMELALVDDPERQLALYRDEAEVRKAAGDALGAADALRQARAIDGDRDPAIKQELATLVLDRVRGGEQVHPDEAAESAQLFAELADEFPGEHAYSYSLCALDVDPAHDRAIQLAMYYAEQLGRQAEVGPRAAAYLKASPHGALAQEARDLVSQAMDSDTADESMIDALAPAADASTQERVRGLLDVADALVRKAKKHEAAAKYQEIVTLDPANNDAVSFLESYLRQTRKYADLRDVLLNAAKTSGVDPEARKGWLREIAGLCETQLRDMDGAIYAWKQLLAVDRTEEGPRTQLRRLLERAQRWDDLATLLEQEAEQVTDTEARISMEKSLAKLHEQKRKDPVAAGEAWARIASLALGDDGALTTAVKLFERGERADLAASVIAENVGAIEDEGARSQLYKKLGELREAAGEMNGAGDAFAEAGALGHDASLWESAERCFVAAEVWEQAAAAVQQRAQLAGKPRDQAKLLATEADYLGRSGDDASAVLRLEQATDLDPTSEEYAAALEERYALAQRTEDLVAFLLRRAEKLTDKTLRMSLRKRAASTQRELLADADAARETLSLLLADGDDPEALTLLAEDAEMRSEYGDAVEYLHRLAKGGSLEPDQKIEVLLKEARLVAEGLDDAEGAIERYESLLKNQDEKNRVALDAIADLHEKRSNPKGTADALERLLVVTEEPGEKLGVAQRLASLYEGELDDPRAAVRILDVVRELDEEDFDALQRLCDLSERLEDWQRVAEHLAALLEVEGDEEEVGRMTRRLAEILNEKLEKGDEALAVLMEVADQGDEPCRQDYVKLGDQLGWKGIVATKLVEWYIEAPVGPARHEALRGAFDRFVEVGRDADAAQVAQELVRTRGADRELAERLEEISVKLKNLDALAVAHDLLVQDLSGPSRAEEMVRQAEILVSAGVDPQEAMQHGEQALTSVSPDDVEPLLARLSQLAPAPGHVVDLYERQVVRCKAPADRLNALARAAQVAADHDALDRARAFFDLALSGGVQEETLEKLEDVARTADQEDHRLMNVLADALAAGGQGSRDGGRTRSALLRRAAVLAHKELEDIDKAFHWLGDALVTHVDDTSLDALDELANEIGDPRRAETVLNRALEEVFDGPLVRKLLARRASLRRDRLEDKTGAAGDLKRLHDLSPSDSGVMDELAALYTELSDWRGMVQLYEDQILRGKDASARAELARKVARLWEDKLDDPREAADAWRRVLRMKSGDPEATEGLERAKAAMLGRPAKAPEPSPAPAPVQAEPEPEAPPAEQAEANEDFEQHEAGATPEPAAAAADEEEDEDDGPTIPPPTSDAAAALMAEQQLAGIKPERPDIQFPVDDEVTISASITELSAEGEPPPPPAPASSAPPPPPSRRTSAPPPPSRGAPPPPAPLPQMGMPMEAHPDYGAPDNLDATVVNPDSGFSTLEDTTDHDRVDEVEDVEEDELIVDDDELIEDG